MFLKNKAKKLTYKKQEKIFSELRYKKIGLNKFFDRELIKIKTKDFLEYKEYFLGPVNIINISNQKNYRSNRFYKHIHAIVGKDVTEIHFDYGNIFKCSLLGLVHFLKDVIPYFLWHLIKWKKPYKLK